MDVFGGWVRPRVRVFVPVRVKADKNLVDVRALGNRVEPAVKLGDWRSAFAPLIGRDAFLFRVPVKVELKRHSGRCVSVLPRKSGEVLSKLVEHMKRPSCCGGGLCGLTFELSCPRRRAL